MYLFHMAVIIFIASCTNTCSSEKSSIEEEKPDLFMKHFKFSHLNGFKSEIVCPNPFTYIVGAKIRTSDHLNQSFPIVTAMKIICSNRVTQAIYPESVLVLDKNIGNWTDYEECPQGRFVYGLTFHLQSINTLSLIADEDYRDDRSSRMYDVFEVGRGRFISGVTLNCSFESGELADVFLPYDPLTSVTLGWTSGFGLRIYCIENRMISGIGIFQEAILSFSEGERMIPVRVQVDCSLQTQPGRHCFPELSWEKIENATCQGSNGSKFDIKKIPIQNYGENSDSPWDQVISCRLQHFVGTTLNTKIDNIDAIKSAYNTIDFKTPSRQLETSVLGSEFRHDWKNKYKLKMEDYDSVVKTVIHHSASVNATNVDVKITSKLFLLSERKKLIAKSNQMENKVSFLQLVGYCGLYKLYFPLFKSKFSTSFEKKIGQTVTKIVLMEQQEPLNY